MDVLTTRQKRLLWAVVQEYTNSAEPVGSQHICQKYLDGQCSPATIRNELAELEEKGFLTHPYTSAGRIPTDKGYRYYVDELMEAYKLTSREKTLVDLLQHSLDRDMNTIMNETMRTLESLAENYTTIVKTNDGLLAELTKQVRSTAEQSRHESLYMSGLSRMFYEPEFENIASVRRMMNAIESKEKFIELLDEYSNPDKVSVHIGHEIKAEDFNEVSLITKEFTYKGETLGSIGVIGPTRMKYSKITTAIDSIAEVLDDLFSRF